MHHMLDQCHDITRDSYGEHYIGEIARTPKKKLNEHRKQTLHRLGSDQGLSIRSQGTAEDRSKGTSTFISLSTD